MNIELPTIPAGVLVLLALLAPYLQAVIQRPKWSPIVKKVLAVTLAIALTAVVLVLYYAYTGDLIPDWPALILLAMVVAQASYALVTKRTAGLVEQAVNPGARLRRDLR
jgi:hypothetical protein